MSVNKAVATRLEQIAQMLELLGEDRFRVAANQRAARVIESLTQDLAELADDRSKLTAIEGIGPRTADKIIEFCRTGRITEHELLRQRVPEGLLELLALPGLGPKSVRQMWESLGVTDLASLQRALDDGSLARLPRFGAKTIDNIRAAIEFAQHSGQRLPLGVAMPLAEQIVQHMAQVKEVRQAAFTGSLRRGRDTIGDLDVLVATTDPNAAGEAFRSMPNVQRVLAAGETRSSVRLALSADMGRFATESAPAGPTAQADLRVVAPDCWGAALMYFTGSREHNIRLRERALRHKLTLNEYGLFPLDDDPSPPQQRGIRPVAARTEQEIYSRLGLPFLPPEIREDRGELDLTEPPRLIELDDIRAELHAHTTASDGALSITQLAEEARRRGFHTIAVTDHSASSVQAHGLSVERLRRHVHAIRQASEAISGITILAGAEVDIHADGRLDYDDDVLAELDIVVASPHTALSQDAAAATRRLLKAIEHPLVRIIAHPTGRLIHRRPGLAPDMAELVAAAAEHHTALEINAHWLRLDLRDTHVRAAVDAGALLAINCDVHALADFDNLRFGVLTARRGWLSPRQCVNAWSRTRLLRWLRTGRT